MGIVSKSSFRYSVILYIGIVLGYINTVLLFPNILSEDVFGLVRILFTASATVAQIAQLGSAGIILRFHSYFRKEEKFILFSIGMLIALIGLFISLAILLLFKGGITSLYEENSSLFNEYFYLLIPFTASIALFNVVDKYLCIQYKNTVTAFLNSIFLRIIYVGLIVLYYIGFIETYTFVILYVAGQALITTFALMYLVFLRSFRLSLKLAIKNINLLRQIIQYGLFAILGQISFFLINRLDILMIGKFMSLEAVAVYSVAFSLCTLILVPAESIYRTTIVLIADASKNNDSSTLEILYKKTALTQLLLGTLIFILISTSYQYIMQLFPEVYRKSFNAFLFLGLSKVIDMGFGVNGGLITNSKHYKVNAIFSFLLLIIAFGTNIYFIPKFGIEGAALATAISITIFNILKYLFVRLKMQMSPFSRNYWIAVLVGCLCYFLIMLIPTMEQPVIGMLINTTCATILFIGSVYILKLSADFNKLFDRLIKF